MPKCQNCGAEFGGAEKFCSVCGQSTAAEQTVQPPPKVKKKSEKKIIIPVMCVLLLAVVGVGGWFGYNALFGDKTRGFDSGNAPEEGTSDAEFIKMLDTVRDYGQQLADAGFTYQCNYYFSLAGAGASSFRFAVENILWLKGEGGDLAEFTADSQYSDWESIARLNFASPYPYYFEGLVFQVQDKAGDDRRGARRGRRP